MKILLGLATFAGVAMTAVSPAAAAHCGRGYHSSHGRCYRDVVVRRPVVVRRAPTLVIGSYYKGHGYWDGRRYWQQRYSDHGHWRYR